MTAYLLTLLAMCDAELTKGSSLYLSAVVHKG